MTVKKTRQRSVFPNAGGVSLLDNDHESLMQECCLPFLAADDRDISSQFSKELHL